MKDMIRLDTCTHASAHKSFSWREESFTDNIHAVYEYCFCSKCNDHKYTGVYKFVTNDLNRNNPSAKEQENTMSDTNDTLSVSRRIKALHAKEKSKLSLKQFARTLEKAGNKLAQDWFNNKRGMLNEQRSEKNRARVSLEKSATKLARRSKKKGAGGSAKADTKVAAPATK